MGQVATIRKPHAENGIAGFQRRQKYRGIGLRAGMRLHIGVTGFEQFLGALDGQFFGNVDVFATAVITLAGITLGIFIRQHRTLRRQHCRAGVVFGCDQFDVIFLALRLLLDRLIDFRVDGLEAVGKNGHGDQYSGGVADGEADFIMQKVEHPHRGNISLFIKNIGLY